jgi:hypothetical protein
LILALPAVGRRRGRAAALQDSHVHRDGTGGELSRIDLDGERHVGLAFLRLEEVVLPGHLKVAGRGLLTAADGVDDFEQRLDFLLLRFVTLLLVFALRDQTGRRG